MKLGTAIPSHHTLLPPPPPPIRQAKMVSLVVVTALVFVYNK